MLLALLGLRSVHLKLTGRLKGSSSMIASMQWREDPEVLPCEIQVACSRKKSCFNLLDGLMQATAQRCRCQQVDVRFNRLGETDQTPPDQFQVRRNFQPEVQTS